MSYYVRMINQTKWVKCLDIDKITNASCIPADLITNDLKTTGNTLSLWKINSLDETELIETVLALSLAREDFATLDVLIMEESILNSFGFSVESSPDSANTKYENAKARHYDLTNLNYQNLGNFSECILKVMENRSFFMKRYTRSKVVSLIVDHCKKELISVEILNEKMRNKINSYTN